MEGEFNFGKGVTCKSCAKLAPPMEDTDSRTRTMARRNSGQRRCKRRASCLCCSHASDALHWHGLGNA